MYMGQCLNRFQLDLTWKGFICVPPVFGIMRRAPYNTSVLHGFVSLNQQKENSEIWYFTCYSQAVFYLGEQCWYSGESARLPPMWPGIDSRTRRHMWVKFVVGSHPCSEGFSPCSPVSPATKVNTSKYLFDLETVDEEPLCGNATANSYLLLFYFHKDSQNFLYHFHKYPFAKLNCTC